MSFSTRKLAPGDLAPWFNLPDQDENRVVLRDLVGQPLLLVFYGNDRLPACQEIVSSIQERMEAFENRNTQVLSISLDSVEERQTFAQTHNLSFKLLSDVDLSLSRQYGVCFSAPDAPEGVVTYVRAAFLLDINLRIRKIYHLTDAPQQIDEILTDIDALIPHYESTTPALHAPVLILPNVLDRNFCQHLIDVWETEGNEDSGFMKKDPIDASKTIGVLDYGKKIRRDHFVGEGKLRDRLDALMQRRVFLEVEKAFNYKITRREDYKIACYDSEPGGYFTRHRDNTTGGTAHRKWAMTLNLNAEEYEGGYLWFPEYGPSMYKPETGSAVIFSCSLMHEATNVTSGRRFALLGFFYGDEEAEHRRQYETTYGIDAYEPARRV